MVSRCDKFCLDLIEGSQRTIKSNIDYKVMMPIIIQKRNILKIKIGLGVELSVSCYKHSSAYLMSSDVQEIMQIFIEIDRKMFDNF